MNEEYKIDGIEECKYKSEIVIRALASDILMSKKTCVLGGIGYVTMYYDLGYRNLERKQLHVANHHCIIITKAKIEDVQLDWNGSNYYIIRGTQVKIFDCEKLSLVINSLNHDYTNISKIMTCKKCGKRFAFTAGKILEMIEVTIYSCEFTQGHVEFFRGKGKKIEDGLEEILTMNEICLECARDFKKPDWRPSMMLYEEDFL